MVLSAQERLERTIRAALTMLKSNVPGAQKVAIHTLEKALEVHDG